MTKKLFSLLAVAFLTVILTIAVNAAAEEDPILITPIQYSEYKMGADVTVRWKASSSTITDNIDHHVIKVRGFHRDLGGTGGDISSSIVVNGTSSNFYYKISGSSMLSYLAKGYDKFRICVGFVMKDGRTWWSAEHYFYISSHNTPVNKISFKIFNGFTEQTKEQIYYACQNWNNALNLGREVVNTYPYSMGTDKTVENNTDGENIVTKRNAGNAFIMATNFRYSYDASSLYQLAEVDIVVNSNCSWTNTPSSNGFYFYNSIVHEMGHVIGLIDKFDSFATEWTMYGKIEPGESKKTTLHSQDIANAKSLYK